MSTSTTTATSEIQCEHPLLLERPWLETSCTPLPFVHICNWMITAAYHGETSWYFPSEQPRARHEH